ncbi:hypothetical protein JZ751_008704 [Albula glossodonta]|uniref:Uncharacterized protein n=1 Tax=Albula glossodonta TaxID=121402 RepID=A0A8T2P1G7_9TELE|nr:hypothetical protein JZ751_008704 [Albula glossodonta]
MPILGCAAINQGPHIGLQQLAALAAATNAFLGPNKMCKFVEDHDTGESCLVCSSHRLLGQLDLSSAVGQLLNETVQAHQKEWGTGTGSLLFMAGAWSLAALECLHEGIPVACIVEALAEGLDSCLEACSQISLPIGEALCSLGSREGERLGRGGSCADIKAFAPGSFPLFQSLEPTGPFSLSSLGDAGNTRAHRSGNDKAQTPQTQPMQPTVRGNNKIKLKHSRHFGLTKSTEEEHSPLYLGALDLQDITHLASVVSHGCEDGMRLVVEACRIQARGGGKEEIDIEKLVTCVLPGPPEGHALALQGFVSHISEEQAAIAASLEERGQSLRVAMFSGDLSEDYRHLGFSRPADTQRVARKLNLPGVHSEADWADEAVATLLKFRVDVLLVGGLVVESLRESCIARGVLVVERVKRGVLRDLAEMTRAVAVAYLSQLSEDCVGMGVRARVLRDCGMVVNMQAEGTRLVTAIITSCVAGKLQLLEDRFWACASRLSQAVRDGRLLPGRGVTEILCARRLQELSHDHIDLTHPEGPGATHSIGAPNLYRGVVLRRMAEGWVGYVAMVKWNSGEYPTKLDAWTAITQLLKGLEAGILDRDSLLTNDKGLHTAVVYDNVAAKLEAWRKALDLVLLVLQTDTEIITGFNAKEAEAASHLMLL